MKHIIDRLLVWGAIAAIALTGGDFLFNRLSDRPPTPLIPIVDFVGDPIIDPLGAGRFRLTYYMRRRASCSTIAHVRWWDFAAGAFDAASASERPAVRADVTGEPQPFSIVVTAPGPGRWGYTPLITPTDDCPDDYGPARPPMAVVTARDGAG